VAPCSAENGHPSAGAAPLTALGLTAPGLTAEGESCLAPVADSTEESCLSTAAGLTEEGDLALVAGSAQEGYPSTPSAMKKGCPPAPGAKVSRQATPLLRMVV